MRQSPTKVGAVFRKMGNLDGLNGLCYNDFVMKGTVKEMKKLARICIFLMMTALLLTLWGCAAKPDPNLEVLDYALVAEDAAALEALEVYINLQTLDLRGSDCYEAIESYIAAHPQVKVTYDVKLGGSRYSPDTAQLKLNEGEYELEELLSNMKYLPELTALELPNTQLNVQQLQQIKDAYPDLEVSYTVDLLGAEMSPDVTELDLSALDPAQVESLTETLQMLPAVTQVQLMDASGTSKFTPADVKKLMDAMPGVTMLYSFELFGQTISTTAERVEFVKVDIGNEGIPQIREALDILPSCTYFLMDTCGVDNEVMAQLRADYPNTKVVWRVFWAFYHDLTDVEMIHCTSDLEDDNVDVLKYCNDVKYLDIGHNSQLHNIDFINYMPKLEIAIIVDSGVYDLEPFANCPNLQWLEIVNCRNVTDLSPLANCTNLKGLNMSAVFGVKDLSPLFELEHMERLYLGKNTLPKGQYEAACEALPNCWVTNTAHSSGNVSLNYAIGWRLDSKGVRAEWYKQIREIFRYSENFYNGKFD